LCYFLTFFISSLRQCLFPRELFSEVVGIPLDGDAKSVLKALNDVGIAASPTTCARYVADVKRRDTQGAHDEQFRKIPDFLARVQAADPKATTDVKLGEGNEFKCCFVAWGASRTIIECAKPVVTLDGAHLSPQGTGVVSSYLLSLSGVLFH